MDCDLLRFFGLFLTPTYKQTPHQAQLQRFPFALRPRCSQPPGRRAGWATKWHDTETSSAVHAGGGFGEMGHRFSFGLGVLVGCFWFRFLGFGVSM